ncbi:Bromo adjacent region [Cordyceps fumosorosea ARSEF 2679]|uniref:Bromo adjacent region n=1 Tax=Cordyceps fumosorosea (strain ARSEF 2679) TaxID=1081104 RepID=A0A167XH55_CORFA|nr:Bromo adjacent region [Cordyceps fumosorosea ARSEF 2679]OAA64974.1 Bromo adjacent region [Cordyceps fumosorosea ARSEF 2679]
MSSKAKKRSRKTAEERPADCPYQVTMMPRPAARDFKDPRAATRRKTESGAQEAKPFFQISPFEPAGKFRACETMDMHYRIDQRKQWMSMTRYNSFVLNGLKFLNGEFIFIANDDAIERQKSGKLPKHEVGPRDFWVARILEIRASDEHHVYARVFWMYSPDELPAATMSGQKTAAGRQPHHGINELIASNHMDIINVVSVVQCAQVKHWIESDDEEQNALYWRQAFDCRTNELSPIHLLCCCQRPANPDKTLVCCTNGDCGKWMHMECLRQDVLKRVFDRLGADHPQLPELAVIKKEEHEDCFKMKLPQAPLSPPPGEDDPPRAAIAVHGDEITNGVVKQLDKDTPKLAELTPPTANAPLHKTLRKGMANKLPLRKRTSISKPQLDIFKADLRMSDNPMMWQIDDLRENVIGGVKTWPEPVICLLCKHTIE